MNSLEHTILRWSPSIVELGSVERLVKLPNKHKSVQDYCSSFLPLICEDARAVIAAELKNVKSETCNRIVLKSVNEAKYEGYPATMTFQGKIETEGNNFLNLCVVLLVKKGEILLGLASERHEEPGQVFIRAYTGEYIKNNRNLKPNEVWDCWYLGCIGTHCRMNDACRELPDIYMPILETVHKAGAIYYPRVSHLPLVGDLNRSQSDAVRTVLSGVPLVLLQGPPGTGKTTTIVTLLQNLSTQRSRVLVCAPSNKAVEVIAEKFYKMCPDAPVLLVGGESRLRPEFTPISLTCIVKELTVNLRTITTALRTIYEEYERKQINNDTWKRLDEKFCKVQELFDKILIPVRKYYIVSMETRILSAQDIFTRFRAEMKHSRSATFRNLLHVSPLLSFAVPEDEFLDNAQVLFCTLSVSGRKSMLAMDNPINTLIVDEAGQSVKAETLIAFQHNPARILLVGDTKQLPATVISTRARDHFYGWSMMHRLADRCGISMLMLEEQYRMHPAISAWPSRRYYDGKLRDGVSIPSRPRRSRCPKWLRPFVFFDIPANGRTETFVGNSPENELEAQYLAYAVQKLFQRDPEASVGIITPYSSQVMCVKKQLECLRVKLDNVRVSSVAFKGTNATTFSFPSYAADMALDLSVPPPESLYYIHNISA